MSDGMHMFGTDPDETVECEICKTTYRTTFFLAVYGRPHKCDACKERALAPSENISTRDTPESTDLISAIDALAQRCKITWSHGAMNLNRCTIQDFDEFQLEVLNAYPTLRTELLAARELLDRLFAGGPVTPADEVAWAAWRAAREGVK